MRLSTILTLLAAIVLHGAPAEAGPVYAKHGMAVSAEPNASRAGVEILQAGGNAFDAAVAVGFALAVTYPSAGNVGGGGFLVGLTAEGKPVAWDFREVAPAAASRDMYLDDEGEIVPRLSTRTHRAVGVPGTVDGLLGVLEKYGTMSRKRVLAPAIRLAEKGFAISYGLSRSLARSRSLQAWDASMASFHPGGTILEFGDTLKQRDLAATLKAISRKGRAGFYEGKVADLIVAEMERHDGLITHEDLRGYHSKEREPLLFSKGEYQFITHPVPSSGGVVLAQILGLLDLGELEEAGFHSARQVHLVTEAERLAYADRNFWLGDPDFFDVPVAKLVSKAYIDRRRLLLPKGKAGKSEGVDHGLPESEETTHYCVADQWGNVVAVTYTLNSGYGMGAVVEGAGFVLNNQMDNFSAKPGVPNQYGLLGAEANAIAPGKRMLSSMTPTIILKDGEFMMTIGSPGGPTIITTVLQIYLNVAVFGMNIQDAIDARKTHHQWFPDVISHETGALSADTRAELEAMGYTLRNRRSIGRAAGIARLENGRLAGHADRRSNRNVLSRPDPDTHACGSRIAGSDSIAHAKTYFDTDAESHVLEVRPVGIKESEEHGGNGHQQIEHGLLYELAEFDFTELAKEIPLEHFHFSQRRSIFEIGWEENGQQLELRVHLVPVEVCED
ncbi:gamma-glutamyltransferase [Candidatus Sumerlaeota bacterium]|nr:gamma-glutamyltransferase [Candidatus Sumerlaeota bacterium]